MVEPPRVVVTRPFDTAVQAAFEARSDLLVEVMEHDEAANRSQLMARASTARGLLTMVTETVDARLLDACPDLEIVSNMAVGTDNIDLAAATERGVLVCNTPDVLTETTAELAIALMFAVSRRVAEADRFVRDGRWGSWAPDMLLGVDLFGATLGIVGAGRIGSAVARKGAALGMTVVYSARSVHADLEQELGARRLELEDLLATADVVSVHVPLSPETRRLMTAERLSSMKPKAILINTARGSVVDEEALVRVLGAGHLFGAGLDVFEQEPRVHPGLLEFDNVVLSPHIGSATSATRRRMAEVAVDNLVRFFSGRPPLSTVNEIGASDS